MNILLFASIAVLCSFGCADFQYKPCKDGHGYLHIVRIRQRIEVSPGGAADKFQSKYYLFSSSTKLEDEWKSVTKNSAATYTLAARWEVDNCDEAFERAQSEAANKFPGKFWTVNDDGSVVMEIESEGLVTNFVEFIRKAIKKHIVTPTVALN